MTRHQSTEIAVDSTAASPPDRRGRKSRPPCCHNPLLAQWFEVGARLHGGRPRSNPARNKPQGNSNSNFDKQKQEQQPASGVGAVRSPGTAAWAPAPSRPSKHPRIHTCMRTKWPRLERVYVIPVIYTSFPWGRGVCPVGTCAGASLRRVTNLRGRLLCYTSSVGLRQALVSVRTASSTFGS